MEKDALGPAPEPGATMLVIPPGLSEEEEALQKKFNKLKKKVRECVWASPNLSQTLPSETTWGECEGMEGSSGSHPHTGTSQCSLRGGLFPSLCTFSLFYSLCHGVVFLSCGF